LEGSNATEEEVVRQRDKLKDILTSDNKNGDVVNEFINQSHQIEENET
jgi:hypothetical protein